MILNQQYGLTMPKWLTTQAIMAYMVALALVTIFYISYPLPWYFFLSGISAVVFFFYYSQVLSRKWSLVRVRSNKQFENKVFRGALLLRLTWVLLIYFIFQQYYGDAFGFEDQDAWFYHDYGMFVADLIRNGNFNFLTEVKKWCPSIDFADIGYGIFLGFLYALSDNSIIVARIIKCILSAYTIILLYRLANRNFGEETARRAAIFCMLWPNFWYYCGCQLKEVEMVFLAILFIEHADQMLRTKNFSVWKVVPLLLIVFALFTIRTPLALVCLLSFMFTIFMTSSRVVGWSKRIIIGIMAIGLVGLTMGNRIQEEANYLWQKARSDEQKQNMEWRSTRGGKEDAKQKFAKYAGATVFAPLIFSIPFPTMTTFREHVQSVQRMLNGGNFIKNILSFFVILSMFMLLFSGKWRDYTLPLSYMMGYLVVLTMSVFAQSERFHQPAMPMEMMFAAYGIQQVLTGVSVYKGVGGKGTYRRWYVIWLVVMVVAAIAWNWFKLAGRGLS